MAEKAIVSKATGIIHSGGIYSVRVEALITDATLAPPMGVGAGWRTIEAIATSSVMSPILPTWRTRIKDAVVAAALASDYALTVDEVMFSGDFGVLGL